MPHGAEYDVVNLTLDYAYCDFCVAQVAHILGKYDIEKEYRERANNYKNIFDPGTGKPSMEYVSAHAEFLEDPGPGRIVALTTCFGPGNEDRLAVLAEIKEEASGNRVRP